MSISGCIEVVVKVLDKRGRVSGTFPGFMAGGGCLSLKQPLQLAHGDTAMIEHVGASEAWKVISFTPSPSKGRSRRHKYYVHLTPTTPTREM